MWAPEIHFVDGRFLVYYSGRKSVRAKGKRATVQKSRCHKGKCPKELKPKGQMKKIKRKRANVRKSKCHKGKCPRQLLSKRKRANTLRPGETLAIGVAISTNPESPYGPYIDHGSPIIDKYPGVIDIHWFRDPK